VPYVYLTFVGKGYHKVMNLLAQRGGKLHSSMERTDLIANGYAKGKIFPKDGLDWTLLSWANGLLLAFCGTIM